MVTGTAERGSYSSEQGRETRRKKIRENLTPERRQRFVEQTKETVKIARAAQVKKADEFAKRHIAMILQMKNHGLNNMQIAEKLNDDGHVSPRGGLWTDQTVRQVMKRMNCHLSDMASRFVAAEESRKRNADAFAERYFSLIDRLQKDGLNLGQIAEALNASGHLSRRGTAWTYHSVGQVIKRTKKKVSNETKSIGIRSEILGTAPVAPRQSQHVGPKRIIGWDRL